jgi:glyoxylase-like metal-dependent hydrolase (beta-lactamase superfamily II)
MRPIYCLGFLPLVLLAFTAPRVQDRVDTPVETQHAGGFVHMLIGRGGNVGALVGPDGVLVVDSQFADMAPMLRAACERLSGQGNRTLRFLVNTHHHGDHTGGNAASAAGTILAHANVRARLLSDAVHDPAALPLVTYANGIELHMNGERVQVEHFPSSHTDGDSVVFFANAKVAHLGDLFFNGRFPFIDRPSGGSAAGLLASLNLLLERLDDSWTLIPGHGPLAKRADLVAYRAMLADCWNKVQDAVAAGRSLADFKASDPFASYSSWNWNFIDAGKFLDGLAAEAGLR